MSQIAKSPGARDDDREDDPLDVVRITVGPLEENTYVVRASAKARSAVMVDPGDEPDRLIDCVRKLGVNVEAIMITHCHFDHVGAVRAGGGRDGRRCVLPQRRARDVGLDHGLGSARVRTV